MTPPPSPDYYDRRNSPPPRRSSRSRSPIRVGEWSPRSPGSSEPPRRQRGPPLNVPGTFTEFTFRPPPPPSVSNLPFPQNTGPTFVPRTFTGFNVPAPPGGSSFVFPLNIAPKQQRRPRPPISIQELHELMQELGLKRNPFTYKQLKEALDNAGSPTFSPRRKDSDSD